MPVRTPLSSMFSGLRLSAVDKIPTAFSLNIEVPELTKCLFIFDTCRVFDPSFSQVADSWARLPKSQRDQHFFARLDFADGQAIFNQLGLTSAPTVMYHPPLAGPRRSNKLSVINYDVNRK